MEPDSSTGDVGTAINENVSYFGEAGKKGNFVSVLILKYFSHAVNIRWPTRSLLLPLRNLACPS
jgi:hypothetical protein